MLYLQTANLFFFYNSNTDGLGWTAVTYWDGGVGWRGVGGHKPGDVSVSGLNVNLFETKQIKWCFVFSMQTNCFSLFFSSLFLLIFLPVSRQYFISYSLEVLTSGLTHNTVIEIVLWRVFVTAHVLTHQLHCPMKTLMPASSTTPHWTLSRCDRYCTAFLHVPHIKNSKVHLLQGLPVRRRRSLLGKRQGDCFTSRLLLLFLNASSCSRICLCFAVRCGCFWFTLLGCVPLLTNIQRVGMTDTVRSITIRRRLVQESFAILLSAATQQVLSRR